MAGVFTGRRMSLDKLRRGRFFPPIRQLIHGPEGVGKSTYAMASDRPIYLCSDAGTEGLDIVRFPEPKNVADLHDAVDVLLKEKHDFNTFVMDPLGWFEPLFWQKVCDEHNVKSIDEIDFGKGYDFANTKWRILIKDLETLWQTKQMNIILLAHSKIKRFQNPEGEDYERWEIALNQKLAGIFRQWCDIVCFAQHEVSVEHEKKNKARKRGVSSGARIMRTQWSAAYDAKNRYGLPPKMLLSWEDLQTEITKNGPERSRNVIAEIEELKKLTTDKDLLDKVAKSVSTAGDNFVRLSEIKTRLEKRVRPETEEEDEEGGEPGDQAEATSNGAAQEPSKDKPAKEPAKEKTA
jgi:hypothetical protein